ncbi:hypothetical protein SCUCBS95973_004825 [Sporothrix curviconia]|uniref:Monopolin complex subunit Csm1/Pcs1 C-terminal domain-containing protein n=1 Tax=Sporothrix curviconia TaxID=1260050 RepID=A0ABP0BS86_9PEZI
MPAAKRGRASAASTAAASTAATANKVTKPAQKKAATAATRRAGERRGAAAAAAAAALEADTSSAKSNARSQRVLADKTNEMAVEPAEEAAPAKPRGRPGRKAAAATATAPAPAPVAEEEAESKTEEAPVVLKKRGRGRPKAADTMTTTNENEDPRAAKPGRRGRRSAASAVEEDTTMDVDGDNGNNGVAEEGVTQQEADATETQFADTMDIEPAETKTADVTNGFQSPLRRSRPSLPVPTSAARGRGSTSTASVSDDASVRRRLGELTKKYDALETRYRDLKEIGVKEAERNFDRLKKQGEDRAKVSNDLIASLKAELAAFREQARDGAKAKRDLEASEARAADLQAQVGELKKALDDAKAASKTLSTKLAAVREVPALPAGITVPGSAIKSSAPTTASARAAVEAMQANSQMAQLKEDLYGDLTGLLVRSALRQGGREMYDCIQTGRNGSLHFKLCIEEEDAADSADSDSAQFVYMPQLDARRDAALIEQLPDYLVEEISFPRMQAAKFYKRVMQALAEDL